MIGTDDAHLVDDGVVLAHASRGLDSAAADDGVVVGLHVYAERGGLAGGVGPADVVDADR